MRSARSFDELRGGSLFGDFGGRGWEGKIRAATYARTQGIPYFGLCLGMQVMVTELARNAAGMPGANSTEFDPETPFPVISLLEEQQGVVNKGGTMRLGGYPCRLVPGTVAAAASKAAWCRSSASALSSAARTTSAEIVSSSWRNTSGR